MQFPVLLANLNLRFEFQILSLMTMDSFDHFSFDFLKSFDLPSK